MLAFHRTPHRCRSCQHRFYTYLSPAAEDKNSASDPTTPAGQGEIR